ncbi:MAG: rod shape-determining protein RodA [Candidatus Limimorpha sp.]
MRNKNIIGKIDVFLFVIYLALVITGLLSIYAAAYNDAHPHIYDLSQNYGKQLMFICVTLVLGFFILLIDAKFFNTFAYIIYAVSIILLLLVLVIGTKVSGATSWISLGPISFQPSEFAKFGTSLALAHYLGKLDTDITKTRTQITAFIIILLPMMLIIAQRDAGSALVFLVFLLVLYREGIGSKLLIIGIVSVALFILTLCIGRWYVIVGVTVLYAIFLLIIDKSRKNVMTLTISLITAIVFVLSVNYVFYNVLKAHQRDRINIILNKVDDINGAGYNLHQSMIAIGSGGFKGKGYLNGTMTKYNFVPEQHTDFIFCTIGEEGGFVGCFLLISLYIAMMLRIIYLAERQRSAFSRIYGYCIACILFFHFTINIGMTIRLVPVIGIPLPFLSYGGSSLLIFSLMIFVFLKQDANRMNIL